MIDPHYQGWWEGQRLTDIRVSGSGLGGAGVSLHVLLHAFAGRELVWFSSIYGDHEDNVQLVAVDQSAAESLERLPSRRPTITGNAEDSLDFEEYALSGEVAARLGISFDGQAYPIERFDIIRYALYSHDDYFFYIEPRDEALLPRVVHCILRQHSFYLGTPVDWVGVLDSLIAMLIREQAIRLKSHPDRKSLTISWKADSRSFFDRVTGRRASREIRIEDGGAHFQ